MMRGRVFIAFALLALAGSISGTRAETKDGGSLTPPPAVAARSGSISNDEDISALPFYLGDSQRSVDDISRSIMEIDDSALVVRMTGKYASPPPPAPPPYVTPPPAPPMVHSFLAQFLSNYTAIFNSAAELADFKTTFIDTVAKKLNLTSSQVSLYRVARTASKSSARRILATSEMFVGFSIDLPASSTDAYVQRLIWKVVYTADSVFGDITSAYSLQVADVSYQTLSPPSPPPAANSAASPRASFGLVAALVAATTAAASSLILWGGMGL